MDEINTSNQLHQDHSLALSREDIARMNHALALAEGNGEETEPVRAEWLAAFRMKATLGDRFHDGEKAARAARAAGDTRPWNQIYDDVTASMDSQEYSEEQLAEVLADGGLHIAFHDQDVHALHALRPNLSLERCEELMSAIKQGTPLERRVAAAALLDADDEQGADYQSAIADMAEARKGRPIEEPTEYTVQVREE